MTDLYLTFLEAASDPWALALISFFAAGLIVVCGALAFDPRPPMLEEDDELTVDTLPKALRYEPEDFFDKVTRFHNEI